LSGLLHFEKRKWIDPSPRNRFTGGMKLRLFLGALLAVAVATGCGSHRASEPRTSAAPTTPVTANPTPIVTPDTSLTAKVARYNAVGRFVVLSFPVGQMPQTGQMFSIYRAGVKVGEAKVTGPQMDNDIDADLTDGTAQEGDDVHQQ
jgi:hypothetical protein